VQLQDPGGGGIAPHEHPHVQPFIAAVDQRERRQPAEGLGDAALAAVPALCEDEQPGRHESQTVEEEYDVEIMNPELSHNAGLGHRPAGANKAGPPTGAASWREGRRGLGTPTQSWPPATH